MAGKKLTNAKKKGGTGGGTGTSGSNPGGGNNGAGTSGGANWGSDQLQVNTHVIQ
jgi:hypothetical protein